MDNIILFPRLSGRDEPATDADLGEFLRQWSNRVVFRLPAGCTLNSTIEPDVGHLIAVPGAVGELVAVLDALLAHCVSNLGGQGGVISVSATLFHQSQQHELAYHGLSAGEYVLVLLGTNGSVSDPAAAVFDTETVGRVERLGGQVHSSNQGELGLRVALHLPAVTLGGSGCQPTGQSGGDAQVPTTRVVLVDDDRQARSTVGELLTGLGCAVTLCTDAASALDALARGEHSFELVLSDLTMPGMSGAEFAQRVRQQYPAVPVALMTGFLGSIAISALEEIGVFAVLEKPFAGNALRQLLAAAREERAARQTSV